MNHLLVRDVTIVHPGSTTDRYSNTVANWDTATRTIASGWLAQRDATEVLDGRDALVTTLVLFLDAGTDITGRDRVDVDGITYEVVGNPLLAWTPRGAHHLEVVLRTVEG